MSDSSLIVVPGEEIVGEAGFLRGHGTYAEASTLVSSLAGVVERVNRLITVRPPHSRYSGEVGDVVVGRVRSVGSKQWRVDVGARQDAVLQLSAINLEGGTLRRRTLEDQLSMRSYYSEADILSAEVHSVMGDGSLSLHARSAKYGLLSNGVLVCVPPGLMRRVKQHFVTLPPHVGCDAILGLNGYIWITGARMCTSAVSAAPASGYPPRGGAETHKDAGESALPTEAAPPASAATAAAGGGAGATLLAVTVDPVTGRAVSSHEAAPAQLSEDAAAAAGVVEAVERRKAAAAERVSPCHPLPHPPQPAH